MWLNWGKTVCVDHHLVDWQSHITQLPPVYQSKTDAITCSSEDARTCGVFEHTAPKPKPPCAPLRRLSIVCFQRSHRAYISFQCHFRALLCPLVIFCINIFLHTHARRETRASAQQLSHCGRTTCCWLPLLLRCCRRRRPGTIATALLHTVGECFVCVYVRASAYAFDVETHHHTFTHTHTIHVRCPT